MNDDDVVIDSEAQENRKRQADSESDIVEEEGRSDTKIAKLKAELEQAKAEKQENLDGWQRSKADYVNLLRRLEADVKDAKAKGIEKAIEALLPAMDALERAKTAGDIPEDFKGIVKQMEGGFKELGVEPIGVVGEPFDASLHEAYGKDTTDDQSKDDIITAVLEPGYRTGERVIRPAKVRVAHFEG